MIRKLLISLAALALAGCAGITFQQPMIPPSGFTGPHLESDTFVSFDGARLGLSKWEAPGEPWAVVVGLHGMNDYAETFHYAGEYWAARGITTYAYDQRGHGRSPNRGIWAGRTLIDNDVRIMVDLARARHPRAIIVVAGISMGGAAAVTAFASDDPPRADRVVLLAPAVWGWSAQPVPNKTALWLAGRFAPQKTMTPPKFVARAHVPTDNDDELRRMGRDPLMLWGARTDTLTGMTNFMQDAWKDTGKIQVPTLYLYGANDQIIPRQASTRAAQRLKAGQVTGFYPQGWHLLLSDNQRERVMADVVAFIRDPTKPLPSGVGPIPRR